MSAFIDSDIFLPIYIAEMFIHFSFTFNSEGNKFKLVLFFHKILLTTFHVIEIPLVFSTKF